MRTPITSDVQAAATRDAITYLTSALLAAQDAGDTRTWILVLGARRRLDADFDAWRRRVGRCSACGEYLGDHGCVTVGCPSEDSARA